jgi:hypothetical protein
VGFLPILITNQAYKVTNPILSRLYHLRNCFTLYILVSTAAESTEGRINSEPQAGAKTDTALVAEYS